MESQGFVVIYRWKVAAEHRAAFIQRWRAITDVARQKGSWGSTLTEASNGILTAIALWPDRETRDAVFTRIEAPPAVPSQLIDEQHLDILDPRWKLEAIPSVELDC